MLPPAPPITREGLEGARADFKVFAKRNFSSERWGKKGEEGEPLFLARGPKGDRIFYRGNRRVFKTNEEARLWQEIEKEFASAYADLIVKRDSTKLIQLMKRKIRNAGGNHGVVLSFTASGTYEVPQEIWDALAAQEKYDMPKTKRIQLPVETRVDKDGKISAGFDVRVIYREESGGIGRLEFFLERAEEPVFRESPVEQIQVGEYISHLEDIVLYPTPEVRKASEAIEELFAEALPHFRTANRFEALQKFFSECQEAYPNHPIVITLRGRIGTFARGKGS